MLRLSSLFIITCVTVLPADDKCSWWDMKMTLSVTLPSNLWHFSKADIETNCLRFHTNQFYLITDLCTPALTNENAFAATHAWRVTVLISARSGFRGSKTDFFLGGGGLFYCIKNDMDILLSGQRYFVDVFFDDTVSHLEYTVLWYGCLLTVALDIKHCRFDGNFSDSKWGC